MNPLERLNLIDAVAGALLKGGYSVSERCDVRPMCFDLIAKREGNRISRASALYSNQAERARSGENVLVIKVLGNADALDEDAAQKMIRLAMSIKGAPIVVAGRTSTDCLEDDVVYLRHNVPVVTFKTVLEYTIDDQYPIAYAGPGGLYAEVDSQRLRAMRESRNLSLSSLAGMLGVSRRTISMYESGMNMLVEVAAQLEEWFGEEFVRPMRVFETAFVEEALGGSAANPPGNEEYGALCNDAERYVIGELTEMGCDVIHVKRAPFDAIVQNEEASLALLAGIGCNKEGARKARILKSISDVTGVRPVVFAEDARVRSIAGSPLISFEELGRMRSPEEILELILERS